MSGCRDAAQSYRERGWQVLPVHVDKRPALAALAATRGTRRWGALRGDPATANEIDRWYRVEPDAGVGVLCVGGLVVVDIDRLDHPDLPALGSTLQAATPRPGLHAYYVTSERLRPRKFGWGELHSGGYVVAPPTPGRDGRRYRWIDADASLSPLIDDLTHARSPQQHLTPRLLGEPHSFSVGERSLTNAAYLGLQAAFGSSFRCLLHDDRRASAAVYESTSGALYYRCFAGCHGDGSLSMAGLHARLRGRRCRLGRTEAAMWQLDLDARCGLVDPVDIPDPGAPDHLRAVEHGFRRLVGLRWLTHPGRPAPFARRFGGPWCGVSEWDFRRSFAECTRLGLIQPAGVDPQGWALWLPWGGGA